MSLRLRKNKGFEVIEALVFLRSSNFALTDIKLRAENGDEAAIEELTAHRKYFRDAELRSRRKLYELADAGDPVAIAKKEENLIR